MKIVANGCNLHPPRAPHSTHATKDAIAHQCEKRLFYAIFSRKATRIGNRPKSEIFSLNCHFTLIKLSMFL